MKLRHVAALALPIILTFAAARTAPAQQQPATAPVPPAILSANTVFISKASGSSFVRASTGALLRSDFLPSIEHSMLSGVVVSPAGANLDIDIRLECASGP